MKYLLSCLFLFYSFLLLAQKPKVTTDFDLSVGPKYKRVYTLNQYQFAFGGRLLSLKKTKNAFRIYRSSLSNLTRETKSSVLLDDGQFAGTLQLKDTVLVYFHKENKLISKKIQITNRLPVTTNIVVDSDKNIAKDFKFSSRFGYDAGNRINAFGIKKSVDQSKFVILYRDKKGKTDTIDGKSRNIINIKVYNQNMSLDWERSMPLPFYKKQINTDDFAVDAKGDFYILASVFEKERVRLGKRNKEDSNFRLQLFKASKEKEDWEIKTIQTDKSIEDAVLYMNASKQPIIVGFYSEQEDKGQVTGCFNAKIDEKQTIIPILHPIPTDTIKAYQKRKALQIKNGLRSRKDKEDLEDLRINKVLTNSNGSFNLFAEQRYAIRNSYYANGATRVNYDLYYRSAYACKFNGKGNLEWFNQLPKNQYGKKGKQAMSFQTLKFGNYSYVLVWEKFANLYKSTGKFTEFLDVSRSEYYFLTTYKINNTTGSVKKLPVINSIEVDKFKLRSFEMGKAVLLNETSILFEGYDGRGKNYLFDLKLNPK